MTKRRRKGVTSDIKALKVMTNSGVASAPKLAKIAAAQKKYYEGSPRRKTGKVTYTVRQIAAAPKPCRFTTSENGKVTYTVRQTAAAPKPVEK